MARKFLDDQIKDVKDEHDDFIETLKECCRDPRVVVELLRTTEPSFKWSESHFKLFCGMLGWEQDIWPSLFAGRDKEGLPLVHDSEADIQYLLPPPTRMAPAPTADESSEFFQVCPYPSFIFSYLYLHSADSRVIPKTSRFCGWRSSAPKG